MNQPIGLCATWIVYIFGLKKKCLDVISKAHVFPQFISMNKLSSLGGEIDCRTVGFLGLVVAIYPDTLIRSALSFPMGFDDGNLPYSPTKTLVTLDFCFA